MPDSQLDCDLGLFASQKSSDISVQQFDSFMSEMCRCTVLLHLTKDGKMLSN